MIPRPRSSLRCPRPATASSTTPPLHHCDISTLLDRLPTTVAGLALRLLALTATRSNEVRSMDWSEIDGDTWTIPAERTKTSKPHRVPLSRQALDALEAAAEGSDRTGLVFTSRTGTPIRNEAVRKLLGGRGTTHGLRSSFRDWCSETGVNSEAAEMALGHAVKGVEGAYRRSDLLEQRREVMRDWGLHLTT